MTKALLQAGMHGTSEGLISSIDGSNFMSGLASGAVSSLISSGIESFKADKGGKLTKFGASSYYKAVMIASGGLSGGISSSIASGNFWMGVRQGIITSRLNHVFHQKSENKYILNEQDPEPWDSNGDGILQKVEADLWGVKGKDEAITVDNSKIDWTGLQIPAGRKNNEIFAISTADAFLKLPWETAATYGGTSFKIIDINKKIVQVLDQDYYYKMRPNNSIQNIVRNIATKIGYPSSMELYNGKFKAYTIHYKNPTIQLK